MTSPSANGQATSVWKRLIPRKSGEHAEAALSVPRRHVAFQRFSRRDTQCLGFVLQIQMPLMLVGLGTTGSKAVAAVIAWLLRQTHRLPRSVDYVLIDSATPEAAFDPAHVLTIGTNGFGTDPNGGRQGFREHYPVIRHAVEQRVQRLNAADSQVPADKQTQEAANFWIVGGCGATSGGAVHDAITLCHHAARRLRIADPRVHVVLLGADMATRDLERTPTIEQKLVIPDTAANNLTKLLGDFACRRVIDETPPGDLPFSLTACDRVWSISIVDQTNGVHDFATTAELIDMIGNAFGAAFFTHAGKSVEDRVRDMIQLGTAGKGRFDR